MNFGSPLKALILNDTRMVDHPGCTLVMRQLLEGCRSAGIQVSGSISHGSDLSKILQNKISDCDVVIINGEGTMHNDKTEALVLTDAAIYAHRCGKPVALINTVWEGNRLTNNLLSCASIIAARESISAEAIRREGFNADVVPDLLMSCPVDNLYPLHNAGSGSVVVMDDVRWEMALLLARYASLRGFKFLRMASRPPLYSSMALMKWGQVCVASSFSPQFRLDRVSVIKDASIVVTGRFHGACLAILAERPFVAIASNTHKIQGLLVDARLGDGAIFLEDSELQREPFKRIDEAILKVRTLVQAPDALDCYREACRTYAENARTGAAVMFQSIAALIKKGL